MKKTKLYMAIVAIAIFAASCKKDATKFTPSGNLFVANFVNNGATLTFVPTTQTVSLNGSQNFPLLEGQNQVNLTNIGITPNAIYYNQPLTAINAVNYSLFLGGVSPTAVDNVLITENYKNYTDSVCAVRFINLVPGSNPVSVNITGQPNASEVPSLAYKAYSNFKQYPAKKVNTSYGFQIRDVSSGTLLASYNLATPYFHNATVVIRGTTGSIAVSAVTHP